MRIGDLTIGDVFYIEHSLNLGPLLRKDSTSGLNIDSFVGVEYLNMAGAVYLMPYDLKVIKVGRLEVGDNHVSN